MFDPSKTASEHAGREIVMGCGPWLREADRFILVVDGTEERDEAKGWEWVQQHRPDLAEKFQSLRQVHDHFARCRWLELRNDLGVKAEIYRADGDDSGYMYTWVTVDVFWEQTSLNHIGGQVRSGSLYQELQLISPQGETLFSVEARRLDFSEGNYPVGDYKNVIPCDLRKAA